MSLSSIQLDAFAEVAKLKSFSKAAAKLNVTQSALSQRILNLEQELGSSLFIRETSGIRLTDLGQRLLRYSQSKSMLEAEFMESLQGGEAHTLSGIVRIASFSTIHRSVLLPMLGDFIKDHPAVNVDISSMNLGQLPGMLSSGAVDLILTVDPINKQEIETHRVGQEEYVLIQSSHKTKRTDIYLDYNEADPITYDFFKHQNKKVPALKRNFLCDIYSLIDGVRMGFGRAVVPIHLVQDMKGIEVVKGFNSMKMPIYLCFYTQAFYTDLQKAMISLVQERFKDYLKD